MISFVVQEEVFEALLFEFKHFGLPAPGQLLMRQLIQAPEPLPSSPAARLPAAGQLLRQQVVQAAEPQPGSQVPGAQLLAAGPQLS